jgi:hypothetical protein
VFGRLTHDAIQTRSKHVDVLRRLVPNISISCVLKVVTCIRTHTHTHTLKIVAENKCLCYSTTLDISLVSFKHKILQTVSFRRLAVSVFRYSTKERSLLWVPLPTADVSERGNREISGSCRGVEDFTLLECCAG